MSRTRERLQPVFLPERSDPLLGILESLVDARVGEFPLPDTTPGVEGPDKGLAVPAGGLHPKLKPALLLDEPGEVGVGRGEAVGGELTPGGAGSGVGPRPRPVQARGPRCCRYAVSSSGDALSSTNNSTSNKPMVSWTSRYSATWVMAPVVPDELLSELDPLQLILLIDEPFQDLPGGIEVAAGPPRAAPS